MSEEITILCMFRKTKDTLTNILVIMQLYMLFGNQEYFLFIFFSDMLLNCGEFTFNKPFTLYTIKEYASNSLSRRWRKKCFKEAIIELQLTSKSKTVILVYCRHPGISPRWIFSLIPNNLERFNSNSISAIWIF